MSNEISGESTREILAKGLKDDSSLLKDLGTVTTFVATASAAGATLGPVAAVALILETSGAVISATSNIIGRLVGRAKSEDVTELTAYERFAALFYLTVLRSYSEALDAQLPSLLDGVSERAITPTAFNQQMILDAAKATNDAALPYLFGVAPLTDEVPLFDELGVWLRTLLANHGVPPGADARVALKVEQEARSRFQVFLSGDTDEAAWMSNYLALADTQRAHEVLSDLSATTKVIAGWLDPAREQLEANEAWSQYREFLAGLPDVNSTMYGEEFGVRKVFQSPAVNYHVARPSGKGRLPAQIEDVGSLLGALVSNRTPGRDLIILAGGPGSGKSTLCRVFAGELAKSPEVHPVFVQLRRLREGDDIPQFLEQQLAQQGVIHKLSDLLCLPNVVVILDGFDELVAASRSRLRHFFNILRADMESGALRNAKVVVSGRDTLFPGGSGLPNGSHVVSLLPMDEPRVRSWGESWRQQHPVGPGNTFHPESFLAGGAASRRNVTPLHHLVTWPLTLHLVARVHTSGGLPDPGASDVEIDKAYLYRSILSETASRQSEQTSGRGRLEAEAGRAFLRNVAWLMYKKAVDSLDVSEVGPLLGSDGDAGLDPGQLAELAVLNAPELSKGEETGFEFVHKSFSEFLVAEVIAEAVERAAQRVQEFGSEESTWRGSEDDAAQTLAGVFGGRLLPSEIQEMLEPMLGGVIPFRKGTAVEDRVPADYRIDHLAPIIERFEALYRRALTGADFQATHEVAQQSVSTGSPIEGLANYAAGLALVGAAAAGQYAVESSQRRFFDIEQEADGFWRFMALCHAGGISLDEAFAGRLYRGISVRHEGSGPMTETSMPWRVHRMGRVDGFSTVIQTKAELAATELHALTLVLIGLLAQRPSGAPLASRRLHGTDVLHVDPGFETSLDQLFEALANSGLIDSTRSRYFGHSDSGAGRPGAPAWSRMMTEDLGDPALFREAMLGLANDSNLDHSPVLRLALEALDAPANPRKARRRSSARGARRSEAGELF